MSLDQTYKNDIDRTTYLALAFKWLPTAGIRDFPVMEWVSSASLGTDALIMLYTFNF